MKKLFILPLLLSVMACSSGGGGSEGSITPGGSDDPDPNPTTDPVTDPTPVEEETLRIGRGFSDTFQEGQLDIAVDTLSAGGRTTISASLVNANGSAFSQNLSVSFSSTCISQGLSTVSSPVQSTNGRAQTTYVAQGCEGDDVVTATVIFDGKSQQAVGVVKVAPAELGSINFVSAEPDNIGLRGTGGAGRQETSTVVFRVRDQSGGAVRGQLVRFQLSTAVGGIELSAAAACSNADGTVQTVVQAGTVAAVVRISAQLIDGESRNSDGSCNSGAGGGASVGSTQSDELTITTGIPDFDSFTIGASILNPEGLDRNDGTSVITVQLSDRFNNPVPDNTAIQFRTEAGSIESQCITTNGQCTVTWTSTNPKPDDGRGTILAFAIGEENFVDVNGSGNFDSGDTFNASSVFDSATGQGVPEAWLDVDENGQYDGGANAEPFIDFNGDESYSGVDQLQSSVLCEGSGSVGCATSDDGESAKLLNVYGSIPLVLSGSSINIFSSPSAPMCGVEFSVIFCDRNSNRPPAGSTITITATEAALISDSSGEVLSSNARGCLVLGVLADPSGDKAVGRLNVSLETPKGTPSSALISLSGCADEDDGN